MKIRIMVASALSLFIFAGSAMADYEAGAVAANSGDWKTAEKEWIASGNQGDTKSQFALGEMYGHGSGGMPLDWAKSIFWLEKAAAKGDTRSMGAIGMVYLAGGNGVKKDFKKAVEWYTKGAQAGDSTCQMQIAQIFLKTATTQDDMRQAFEWMKKAAEQNRPGAMDMLGQMLEKGIGVPPSPEAGKAWHDKANEVRAQIKAAAAAQNQAQAK